MKALLKFAYPELEVSRPGTVENLFPKVLCAQIIRAVRAGLDLSAAGPGSCHNNRDGRSCHTAPSTEFREVFVRPSRETTLEVEHAHLQAADLNRHAIMPMVRAYKWPRHSALTAINLPDWLEKPNDTAVRY
jgi:hypothetical protein